MKNLENNYCDWCDSEVCECGMDKRFEGAEEIDFSNLSPTTEFKEGQPKPFRKYSCCDSYVCTCCLDPIF